ncbi:hypothetical protein PM082_019399 [Marasmius tenuissimus]|nr:hypothetical protein PM082_019399 [Marasmius tenuissimus]
MTKAVTTTRPRRGFWIWRTKQEAEFEQYNEVKRGDIRLIRDLCKDIAMHPIRSWRELARAWKLVEGYEGHDAQKGVDERLGECSRTLRANHAHLFGINHSRIPMLILLGDLVPAGQAMTNVGELGWACFSAFAMQLGCEGSSVWVNAQRGVLCRGPWGRDLELRWSYVKIKDLPSTTEHLQENVYFRSFTCFKSKRERRRSRRY